MHDFWIDFSGYCKITAHNRDSAEALLYRLLDSITEIKDASIDIDGIEEISEG